MNLKGGEDLLEVIYRIDERLKSMHQGMADLKTDMRDIRQQLDGISKQTAVNESRINEIDEEISTAKKVSWSAIATAAVSFFIGGK